MGERLLAWRLRKGDREAYRALVDRYHAGVYGYLRRQATARVGAVHVVLNMLTREGEDFSFVNLDGDMQPVEAWIEWPAIPGDAGRARLDKPDRIYVFDGEETVFYHPRRREAYRAVGAGVDMDPFWPAAWVREILNRPANKVEVLAREESAGRGRMLLREHAAPGRRLEPSFLGDFDRETEVVWDLATQRVHHPRRSTSSST